MKIKYFALTAAVVALAACTSNNFSSSAQPQHQHQHHEHAGHSHSHSHNVAHLNSGDSRVFSCQNGMTATVKYTIDERNGQNNAVNVSVDTISNSVNLPQAVSGSGVRYASDRGFYNKATEWHEKAGEAYFAFTDPYGNKVETSCNAK